MINTRPRINEVNGTIKAKSIPSRFSTIKNYEITLHRGSEEKLIEKLGGDLSNLITFCDNKYSFDNTVARHYGGRVQRKVTNDKIIYFVICYVD